MFPVRVLSINNGWDLLINQKPNEWQDIQAALSAITVETLDDDNYKPSRRTKEAKRISDLVAIWDEHIQFLNWEPRVALPSRKGISKFQVRNVKNKVAARILIRESLGSSSFTGSLLADAPRALRNGLSDIFVLLIPADDVRGLYSDKLDVELSISEASCRTQLEELYPLITQTPIVIIFFSQYKEDLEIEELKKIVGSNGAESIDSTIEFAPEYYQAGVGILSYFSEVLRQKHPNINAKVRIEQEGRIVRMHVESPSGDIETIEKELKRYALVVAEQAPIESLFASPIHILRLEHKLDMARVEVKQYQDLLRLSENHNTQQIDSLKQEVASWRGQVGQLIYLATQQSTSHERLQLAQINHSSVLFKDLINEAQSSQAALAAIRNLEHSLLSGIATIDMEDKINEALTTLKQEQPTLLTRIAGQIEGAGYGAGAGFVLDWLKQHMP